MDDPRDHAQRQKNSRLTQTEQNWVMEYTEQVGDIQTKKIREAINRQRRLTCQVIEEIEQLWEETQRERNETAYLKTKTEQQEGIDTQTSEQHEQSLVMKKLRLEIENVTEKLKESKREATREKMQLQRMWAEIYQERETLERRHNEIINERHKLEMIKYDKTKSQERQEPQEPIEQIKAPQEIRERPMADSLLSLIHKSKKIMTEAKQMKEQMEKNMTDIKQVLNKDISQHKDQTEHIKHNITLKMNEMKQRWENIQDVQKQKAVVPEMERRDRQKEVKDIFDSVKIKLSRIQEEMDKVWDMLEVTPVVALTSHSQSKQMENMKSNSQRQSQDTDVSMKTTQRETDMQGDMQEKRKDIDLAQMQSENDEIERIKTEIRAEKDNVERSRQLAKTEMDELKRMKESIQRQQQELDDKFQRTKKEIKEKEEMNAEIERKKTELVKMMRINRRQKEEISKMKDEIEQAKQEMDERHDKTKGQRSEQMLEQTDKQNIRLLQFDRVTEVRHKKHQFEEDTDMQRGIPEVEEARKMVTEGTEQSRQDYTDEKSQMKWMKFREKKKKRELDQRLEKTMKERDELEIVKIKIQQQREEFEQKLEHTMTTVLVMGEMKANLEKTTAVITSTCEEMLKAQRQMEKSKEEVQNYLDKLSAIKAQVSKWIMTESAIKMTFSVNTSALQESLEKTHEDSREYQIVETLLDKEKEEEESEITKQFVSLQQSVTLEDQHQSEEIKEGDPMPSEHQQRQELTMETVFFQMQTEIHEETLMDDDKTDLVINERERAEVEKQISELKEKEEEIKEQIKNAVENIEEKNQEIKRIIAEINALQSQRPVTDTGLQITLNETGNVEDSMRLDKQGHKSRKDPHIHIQDMDGGDIKRLWEEIQRTKEIIRLVKSEFESQAEESRIEKDHDEDNQIEGLLEEMKKFQELLKMAKTAMRQDEMQMKEEMSNIKVMKTAAKKRRRELDQRLEKTLRERDELDLLRLKMQRQTEVTEQTLEKMTKIKSTMEKMSAKAREKSENIEIITKETKVKLRQLENLNYKIEATKHVLRNSYHLIRKERSNLEKFKTDIRQVNNGQSAVEDTGKKKGVIRKHIRDETEGTEQDQMIKIKTSKEMEEKEAEISRLRSNNEKLEEDLKLLKHSLDQKHGEIEQLKKEITVKQSTEREESEMQNKQIQTERENVRTARQQPEPEIYEMTCIRESYSRAELAQREQIEMELVRVGKSELEKESEGHKTLKPGRTVRDNMSKTRSQIKMDFEKMTIDGKADRDEMAPTRDDIAKQKQELEIILEKYKRERREMEVLMSELEIRKKENGQMFRKSVRKEQEIKMMWAEVREEKASVAREKKKWKKELDQRLERIMRERDELEIMKLKLQRGKDESKGGTKDSRTSTITKVQLQKHWELMQTCMEKYKQLTRHSEDLTRVIKSEKLYMETQAKLMSQAKERIKHIKIRVKRQKKMMTGTSNIPGKKKKEEELPARDLKEPLDGKLETMSQQQTLKPERKRELGHKKLKQQRDKGLKDLARGDKFDFEKMKGDPHEEVHQVHIDQTQKEEEHTIHIKYGGPKKREMELDGEKDEGAIKLEVELLKKEKVDLELMRSDIQEQSDILERQKRHLKEQRDELEMTKAELQQKKDHVDSLVDKINRENSNIKDLILQVQTDKDKLENVMNAITLKQKEQELKESELNRQRNELETSKSHVLAEREELEALRKDLNRRKQVRPKSEKLHVVRETSEKGVQTEGQQQQLWQESNVEKQDLTKAKEFLFDQDIPQSNVKIQTDELKHQCEVNENKHDSAEEKKIDFLRNMWKDTKTERKEINQMKHRGYEMRNNLEKRLKVINQFVKRPWLQKDKDPPEKTALVQRLSDNTTSQSDCERDLQQLKVQMLNEIERLHIKEKTTRALKTCDKANQTLQVEMSAGTATMQVTDQASTRMYQEQMNEEETEVAAGTASGLFCQLRHYCYRCCGPCCACCKQVCPEEK